MSILIDDLIKEPQGQQEINGKWYVAKPFPFFGVERFWKRLNDALFVLSGSAFAVHYKIDEESSHDRTK